MRTPFEAPAEEHDMDEIIKQLTEHRRFLAGLIEAKQKHREALRDGPVHGDAAANNLAIENLEKAYDYTGRLLAEALGNVPPEKD
jgi:hypothetical protein